MLNDVSMRDYQFRTIQWLGQVLVTTIKGLGQLKNRVVKEA